MNYTIRAAAPDDFSQICTMYARMLDDIFGTPHDPAGDCVTRQLQQPHKSIFVADVNDRVVGFMSLNPDGRDQDAISIDELFIDEDFRGHGIATSFLNLADLLIATAKTKATLQVFKNNPLALYIYARRGFRICGEHTAYYKMAKSLRE